jgi:hypothetical protein
MFIQSPVPGIGLRPRYRVTVSIAIRTRSISLRVKIISMIVLSAMVFILCAVVIARTGAMPEIIAPPKDYLPGNALPQLPKDANCVEPELRYLNPSCVIKLAGQTIYVSYDPNSRMIVHTGIFAHAYKIGDLIIAWGYPAGISRWGTSIVVYWGMRSAVLYTDSFRPESPVEFIQYDMQEHVASPWQGFKPIKTSGQSDNLFGNS